jgi:hypothetical protein
MKRIAYTIELLRQHQDADGGIRPEIIKAKCETTEGPREAARRAMRRYPDVKLLDVIRDADGAVVLGARR